jgi:hypothetical protein
MEDLESAVKQLKDIIKSWKKSIAPEQVKGQIFFRLILIDSELNKYLNKLKNPSAEDKKISEKENYAIEDMMFEILCDIETVSPPFHRPCIIFPS